MIFLVEWQEAPAIRQIVKVDDRALDVNGLRPNRIITHDHKVLIRYDGNLDSLVAGDSDDNVCGFAPLQDKEGAFLVSVSAPTKDNADFHWVLHRLGAFIDVNNLHMTFFRVCDEGECEMLNRLFPEWLEKIIKMTEDAKNIPINQ
jgi:hypothetical protein